MLVFYPTACTVVNYSNTFLAFIVTGPSRNSRLSFGARSVTICAYVETLAGDGMAASVDDERRVNKIGDGDDKPGPVYLRSFSLPGLCRRTPGATAVLVHEFEAGRL
jgi:hypothetical protein